MWKQYIKQALYQLKEDRLISIVCMVGTALAICMIMVIVLTLQIRIKVCRKLTVHDHCMSRL